MDLILLQPGNPALFGPGGEEPCGAPGSLVDGATALFPGGLGRCIELVSIHQGMQHPVTTDAGNIQRSSGRPVITEFTCVKYVDKTSVNLYDFCLRAEPLGRGPSQPTRIYICRNSGDKIANIITIELRDALVTEIQFQSHPDDMPTEQFKLNFTEIAWTYAVQSPDGPPGQMRAAWDVVRNRPASA